MERVAILFVNLFYDNLKVGFKKSKINMRVKQIPVENLPKL